MTEDSQAAVDRPEPTPAVRRISGGGGGDGDGDDGDGDGGHAADDPAQHPVDTPAGWDELTPAVRPIDGTAGVDTGDGAADADGSVTLTPAVRPLSQSGRDWEAGADGSADAGGEPDDPGIPDPESGTDVPEDVREYARFSKIDGATYERANEFLRDRTYITAREWAMARLCADFRTETGVEMTKIGENLPELVPFMTDTYSPQAVNQARSAFDDKVRKAGATFLYGAMCDFYTAEELDDLMYEITEVAKFLLEVEGVELTVDEELDAEERISSVMREVRESSAALRHDEFCCPNCGHEMDAATDADGIPADEPADD